MGKKNSITPYRWWMRCIFLIRILTSSFFPALVVYDLRLFDGKDLGGGNMPQNRITVALLTIPWFRSLILISCVSTTLCILKTKCHPMHRNGTKIKTLLKLKPFFNSCFLSSTALNFCLPLHLPSSEETSVVRPGLSTITLTVKALLWHSKIGKKNARKWCLSWLSSWLRWCTASLRATEFTS